MTLHGKGSEGAPPKTAPQRRCGGRRRVREGSRASPPRTSSNGAIPALDGRRDGRGRPRPSAPRERAVARPSSTSHDVVASSPSPSPSPSSQEFHTNNVYFARTMRWRMCLGKMKYQYPCQLRNVIPMPISAEINTCDMGVAVAPARRWNGKWARLMPSARLDPDGDTGVACAPA